METGITLKPRHESAPSEAPEGSAAERRRRARASGGGAPRALRKDDRVVLVGLLLLCILVVAAPPLAAQPPTTPTPAQEGFVPFDPSKATEQLPAAPLVLAAYAVAWIVVFAYVWSIWQRLARVEREMVDVSRRVGAKGGGGRQ